MKPMTNHMAGARNVTEETNTFEGLRFQAIIGPTEQPATRQTRSQRGQATCFEGSEVPFRLGPLLEPVGVARGSTALNVFCCHSEKGIITKRTCEF